MKMTGIGVDYPDVNLGENYTCHSERNYNHYCNPEVDNLIAIQSREPDIDKRKQVVWQIERKLAEDGARPAGRCRSPRPPLPASSQLLVPPRQGARAASEQHLQRCAKDVWLDK